MQPVPQDLLKQYVQSQKFTSTAEIMSAMKEMFRDVIQTVMEVELDEELGRERCQRSSEPEGTPRNYRNGYAKKTVKTQLGEVDIKVPRDRNGTFEPKIIGKYSRNADGMEDKILALYACGMSQRDIAEQSKELYDVEISPELVTKISEKIMPEVTTWQNRPLESVYPFIFMDAIHYKVKEDHRYVTKAAYVVLGITLDGRKDILGVWIGEHESSKFWLNVLNDLKSRGVMDVYLFCTDGLCGIGCLSQKPSAALHCPPDPQLHQICELQGHQAGGGCSEEDLHGGVFGRGRSKPERLCGQVAQAVSLLCEELGGKLGNLEHLFRIPHGDSEDHIHDEHHRGPEPPVPADHQKQTVLYQRQFSAPDALPGVPADREALACPVPELGHGAQPAGDHVRRPGCWLTPLC